MGNLGTMEPEEILQLLTGSIACAFVFFLLIIVYVVIARRSKGMGKQPGLGTGSYRPGTMSTEYRTPSVSTTATTTNLTPASPLAAGPLPDNQVPPIDVSARLAGTGREAWLEQGASYAADTSVADDYYQTHAQEILRLLRDLHTEQFCAQVAGVRYRSLKDIRDRAVGERVLAAITHLLHFSNGMAATDQGVITLELPPCNLVKVPTGIGSLSEAREPGEIIRLMSNPGQDHFCVHVADQCYRRLVDVSERETGQYLLEAITRMLQFSEGMLATNSGIGVVPVPALRADVYTSLPNIPTPNTQISDSAAAHASSMPSLDSQPAQPTNVAVSGSAAYIGEPDHFLEQLMSQATPPQPQNPVRRPSLVSSIRSMRKETRAEPLPPLNLAEEIDRIFQSKLVASGLSATNASVETNPDGGVRIRVGIAYYDSPDEVPDPQLREMLKFSIAEWERS